MRKALFLIPSLVSAGFLAPNAAALPHPSAESTKPRPPTLFERFRLDHLYTLAAHRSHSSHGSHSSHRSSSGGGYTPRRTSPPAPLYTPPPVVTPELPADPTDSRNRSSTPPSSVLPSPPAALKMLPGNSEKFRKIVEEVQFAMMAFGYYSGSIDGVLGPESKAALSKLQADYGLKITGTITPEVLNALGIVAR